MLIDLIFQVITSVLALVTIVSFNEYYYGGSLINLIVFIIAFIMTLGGLYLSITVFDVISKFDN